MALPIESALHERTKVGQQLQRIFAVG